MPASLEAFLRPRSIALIGASNRPNSLGGRVTARLFGSGYQGRLIPVNPRPDPILGLAPVASVADAEGPIDLALIAIPRDAVRGAVLECLDKGVPAICVVTAGFKEVDAEGAALERELVALVRARGARMIGPNCMGLTNTSPQCTFDATFSPVPPLPGPIGFASQSGALGVAVLSICHQRQIGFSQFVSMGNKADVAEDDLLEAWEDDPEVRVIAMYLESVRDPQRFLAAARRVTKKKPVVVVKAGRTAAGARAASSHTGALAGADQGAEALFRQAGVLRVDTVEEMLETSLALSRCALPAGNRVAVLTNAGGPGIMAADALDRAGLRVAELETATKDALRAILPREAAVTNPVDMIASAGPVEYGTCLELLLKDQQVDAVVPVVVTPPAHDALDVLKALMAAAARHAKPALGVFMVGEDLKRLAATPGAIPTFPQPEGAARALADMVRSARVARGRTGDGARLPRGRRRRSRRGSRSAWPAAAATSTPPRRGRCWTPRGSPARPGAPCPPAPSRPRSPKRRSRSASRSFSRRRETRSSTSPTPAAWPSTSATARPSCAPRRRCPTRSGAPARRPAAGSGSCRPSGRAGAR